MLIKETLEDPLRGMPLLTVDLQIIAQPCVDDTLVLIQRRAPRRQCLPCSRERRVQRRLHRRETHCRRRSKTGRFRRKRPEFERCRHSPGTSAGTHASTAPGVHHVEWLQTTRSVTPAPLPTRASNGTAGKEPSHHALSNEVLSRLASLNCPSPAGAPQSHLAPLPTGTSLATVARIPRRRAHPRHQRRGDLRGEHVRGVPIGLALAAANTASEASHIKLDAIRHRLRHRPHPGYLSGNATFLRLPKKDPR